MRTKSYSLLAVLALALCAGCVSPQERQTTWWPAGKEKTQTAKNDTGGIIVQTKF